MSYRMKPVVKEPSGQTLPKQANAGVSLSMYVALEDRRRFLQQAGKAAENFGVKLVRPHVGNLVAPFLVKGKQKAAHAFILHMEACISGNRSLRMPLQIPVDLQPLLETKQAPGIWLKMPLREDDPSESCALIGKEKDRALMLKKLADIEGQVRSSESTSPDIAPAHYGKAIGKGGARISYIREKHGVWVNVPKDRESSIVVSGLSANVRGAIKELEELVQQDVLQQRVVLPVEILPEDIGIAIGKGGCHASKLQEEFGVKLRTHSREHPEWPLVVEGPLGAAEKAVATIQLHVAERRRRNEEFAEERRRREEMKERFPVCVEPGRIGKRGFRIRHVAQRHGVTIQLPERNKPGAQILVTGRRRARGHGEPQALAPSTSSCRSTSGARSTSWCSAPKAAWPHGLSATMTFNSCGRGLKTCPCYW
ncbi:hypothetical protein C7M84_003245 [Penaeus vannamei]|uniref:K Homology domain-containing protein n=1 Tax=Penaeus vannamei TaxID=6689 RepID=A0A3R7P7Z6_PENVA|nr:hypothetical protein C7M84_003245 [Penaeus vannamei]